MEARDIIRSFCEKVGIGLEPDADGSCSFDADGLLVTINDLHELDAVALIGDLGEPPPERLDDLYKIMLEANHLFGGTGGATISLDQKTGHFALCRVLQCKALDDDAFYAETERFVSSLEVWTKIIGNFRDSSPADNKVEEASPDVSGFIAV